MLSKNSDKNTNHPTLRVLCCLDQEWLTLHISWDPDPSLYFLTESYHAPSQSFRHGTAQTGAILLPLPELFVFPCSLSLYTTQPATYSPSHASHCHCQFFPRWCLPANHIHKANLDTSVWMVHESTPPSVTLLRLGHHQPLPRPLLYVPHLDLLTHDPQIYPLPWSGAKGSWRKAGGASSSSTLWNT